MKYNFLGFAQKRKLTNVHHDPSDLWGTIRFSRTRNPWLNRLFIPDYWWLNAHVSLFDPELKINPYPHCWLYLIMYPRKIVGLYHHCCLLHPHVLKQSHPKCFRGKYSKCYANIHKLNAKKCTILMDRQILILMRKGSQCSFLNPYFGCKKHVVQWLNPHFKSKIRPFPAAPRLGRSR